MEGVHIDLDGPDLVKEIQEEAETVLRHRKLEERISIGIHNDRGVTIEAAEDL